MKKTDNDTTQDSTPDSPSNESRRAFLKTTGATVIAAPAILTSRKSMAQVVPGVAPSPATTPWQVDLPDAIEPLPQTDLLTDPNRIPQGVANTPYGECGRNQSSALGRILRQSATSAGSSGYL
jgi:hypothetical protein